MHTQRPEDFLKVKGARKLESMCNFLYAFVYSSILISTESMLFVRYYARKRHTAPILMNSIISVEVLCISLWNCKERCEIFFCEPYETEDSNIYSYQQDVQKQRPESAPCMTLWHLLHSLSVTILSWAVFKIISSSTHYWPFLHCGCRA